MSSQKIPEHYQVTCDKCGREWHRDVEIDVTDTVVLTSDTPDSKRTWDLCASCQQLLRRWIRDKPAKPYPFEEEGH